MIFKLLVEEIVKNYNAYENIHKDIDVVSQHDVPTLHTETSAYTINSKLINNKLWDDKRYGDLHSSTLKNIKLIHNNLDTSKKASQEFHVFTGVRRDPQELVKDSGGLLHHAAFISSSAEPDIALGFSKPINDVHHIIRIKVRKGQKVGGYIANHSLYPGEKEFLIKSNQILHINPNPTDYVKNNGIKVRVHDAIILNNKEIDKESEHPEVQGKLDFDERLY